MSSVGIKYRLRNLLGIVGRIGQQIGDRVVLSVHAKLAIYPYLLGAGRGRSHCEREAVYCNTPTTFIDFSEEHLDEKSR